MSTFEFIDRIKHTDDLIRRQATGSAIELAGRIGVHRSTVFEYFDHLKGKGAEISFDKRRGTYYYKNNFMLIF